MEIIILLIVISILVASGFLFAFIWAVKSGQFDDASTPSIRMLWDNPTNKSVKNNQTHNN